MKIAIVAPEPVPFVYGGAENLVDGLARALRDETPHACDIVKLPSPEDGFWPLMASYRAFAALDLSPYDLVVSTKYPSWMVEHPNHVCWMLHRLRGLYDTYGGTAAIAGRDAEPCIAALLDTLSVRAGERSALLPFFEQLDDAAARLGRDAPEWAFPGPLTRAIVHFLDGIGLARGAITRYAAISRTVARRADYFPAGAEVAVAYPPTALTGLHEGEYRDLFTVSRLDGPKRIGLLVEAMRHVRAPVRLRIAGTGPQREALARAARPDPRIEWLGFLDESRLAAEYADALAVPFVPLDEDFGLVTVEAMRAAKPVVTTTDSGGPAELVTDGIDGFVVEPTPQALGAAFERLAREPATARRMGAAARARGESITWSRVIEALVVEPSRRAPRTVRPRAPLTVALSYPVDPPRGGGQVRVLQLYRELAAHYDVDLVTLGADAADTSTLPLAPGLREVRIGKSARHAEREARLSAGVGWVPVTDVALAMVHASTPAYAGAIAASMRRGGAIVASHPYALPAIEGTGIEAPLWYEAHNVELALKRAMLPDTRAGRDLVERVREVEAACCARAQWIVAVGPEDRDGLVAEYGADPARIALAPNGVDTRAVRHVCGAARRANRERLGLAMPCAAFMGSWHGPNIDAATEVLAAARELPQVAFLVVGSVCGALAALDVPANCRLLGSVDEDAKNVVLAAADLALNPMASGSGSNLKMLDYLAAGVPVLCTRFGARGLALDERHVMFQGDAPLADAISAALSVPEAGEARSRAAREHVERHYDWRIVAAGLRETIEGARSR